MTDEPKTDEPAMIQAVVGPYAGQRLTVSRADAEAAIAEGWAIDPFAAIEEGKDMTDEQRAEIKAKAEKAARKLRGEPEPEASPEGAPAPTPTRDMAAEPGTPYKTR